MNLSEIRKKVCFRDYMELAKKWEYKMIAPDQDLLNGIFYDVAGNFDEKYSVFAKSSFNNGKRYVDIKEKGAIIHYTGNKPWQGQYVHYDIEQLWWDYAKETPFYAEFLEEYVDSSINDNLVYDTMNKSMEDKEILKNELARATDLIKKLSLMLNVK